MSRLLILCVVASCALSAPAQAQSQGAEPALGVGTKELTIGGSFTGSKSSAATSTFRVFELSTHLGFVMSKHLEVLAGANVTKVGDLDPRGALTGGLLYNFKQDGRIIPFAGATFGKALGTAATSPILDLHGGFRVMTPGGGGALIIRPFYQRQLQSINVFGRSDFHRFGVSFGPSIFF